jgi:peptidoglycan biosynthesis protein MviN/MurJ (putative lipid II flippase)
MRRGVGGRRPSEIWIAVAIAASAWLMVLVALAWERPDPNLCEHRSIQVAEDLTLAAAALAIAAMALGTHAAWRSRRAGGSRAVGIATALVGLATLFFVPAAYVIGDAFLYANC